MQRTYSYQIVNKNKNNAYAFNIYCTVACLGNDTRKRIFQNDVWYSDVRFG